MHSLKLEGSKSDDNGGVLFARFGDFHLPVSLDEIEGTENTAAFQLIKYFFALRDRSPARLD